MLNWLHDCELSSVATSEASLFFLKRKITLYTINVHVYTHMCAHICINTHVYTHTHTSFQFSSSVRPSFWDQWTWKIPGNAEYPSPILIPYQILNETHMINYVLFRSIVLERSKRRENKTEMKCMDLKKLKILNERVELSHYRS